MRNRPKRAVESEFMKSEGLNESSSLTKLLISESRKSETLVVSSGSLSTFSLFKRFAVSFSTEDFPHKTKLHESRSPSIALFKTKKKNEKVLTILTIQFQTEKEFGIERFEPVAATEKDRRQEGLKETKRHKFATCIYVEKGRLSDGENNVYRN